MIDSPITGSYQVVHVTPTNLSLAGLRAVLTKLLDRHEALRTVFPLGENGTPIQVISSAREPEVRVEDLSAVPADMRLERLAAHLPTSFDLRAQPSLRVIAGLVDGMVSEAGLVVHNVAIDGAGRQLLQADFEELIEAEAAAREPKLVSSTWQPVDQAMAESDAKARAANADALRHWRQVLATAPHSTVPFYWSGSGPEVPGTETTMVSRRFAESCQAALGKYNGTMPTLVLALFTSAIASWTGQPSCLVRSTTSNRISGEQATSIGHYATDVGVFVSLDGDPSFSDIVRRSWTASLTAYGNSAYDNGELAMTEARQSLQVGARFAYAILYDYYGYLPGSAGATELPEDPQITQSPDGSPIMALDVLPQSQDVTTIRFRCPASLLSADAAQLFLRQLLELAERVAVDDDPSLSTLAKIVDLPAPWHGPGWVNYRQSWIKLDDVAGLLREHDGVLDAVILPSVAEPAADPALIACVVPQHPALSPDTLSEHMRDRVSHHPSTALPSRYVICKTKPNDATDLAGWLAQPTMASGPGMVTGPAAAPQGRREQMLAEAFAALHPDVDVRVSATYAELHGEFLRIPAMLERIDHAGYGGLAFGDFMGMAPLRQLARRLSKA